MTLLKMFAARDGDAFLLKEDAPIDAAILVDGGYASTFHDLILPILRDMHASGQSIDLVIATHIDADHISGLLEFFKVNGKSEAPAVIRVNSVWHNSLRCLPIERSNEVSSRDDQDILSAICSQGFPSSQAETASPQEISARQGSSLAALLLKGGYSWNNGDGHQSIHSSNDVAIDIAKGVQLRVLGPSAERLDALRRQWLSELRRFGLVGKVGNNEIFDDAFEFLCALNQARDKATPKEIAYKDVADQALDEAYIADDSLNNGSSIAVIIETPSSRMLFLGDAWAEDMAQSIRLLPGETFPIFFDAIKIAHHGSVRNTSPALLELVDAPVFLLSSNGAKHNHPDFPVLKAIVDRPSRFTRHLHFNYSTPASRQLKNYRSRSEATFVVHENSTGWIAVGSNNHD